MKYIPVGGPELWRLSEGTLHGDVIAFPEVAIDGADADVPTLLRPIFNIVWNAFGFLQCDLYTAKGTWKGQ